VPRIPSRCGLIFHEKKPGFKSNFQIFIGSCMAEVILLKKRRNFIQMLFVIMFNNTVDAEVLMVEL
jgi:hypothetical protein